MDMAQLLARLQQNEEFARAWVLEEPKITLAANVAILRSERGLTQQQLAELAGIHQPRIAEIERGDGNPRLKTLARIASALRVDVAVLLTREDDDDSAAAGSEGSPAGTPRRAVG
ncbi:MAG TPA: helix-turn-helix transcriptional regulator [Longimicrobiaceae bacterium]|nr:helix-turn-helix transcriptional regulator [Longimicrobiaceae bacterium]